MTELAAIPEVAAAHPEAAARLVARHGTDAPAVAARRPREHSARPGRHTGGAGRCRPGRPGAEPSLERLVVRFVQSLPLAIDLLEQGRLDAGKVVQLDVLQTDATAGEGGKELEEVGVAGGLLADLADALAAEAPPGTEDLDRLEKLCDMVRHTSLCGLGQTAPNPTLSTLRYFRSEYESRLRSRSRTRRSSA